MYRRCADSLTATLDLDARESPVALEGKTLVLALLGLPKRVFIITIRCRLLTRLPTSSKTRSS